MHEKNAGVSLGNKSAYLASCRYLCGAKLIVQQVLEIGHVGTLEQYCCQLKSFCHQVLFMVLKIYIAFPGVGLL